MLESFIGAFTDLGTPLIFDYQAALPTQIFNLISESGTNPIGYALVLIMLVIIAVLYLISKRLSLKTGYEMMGRSATNRTEKTFSPVVGYAISAGVFCLILISALPHLGVILNSIAEKWFFTVLPSKFSLGYYQDVFQNNTTSLSIENSLLYSSASATLDLVLGLTIAHFLARENFRGKNILDAFAMLPLALPGIVLAFGYVAGFNIKTSALSWINPRNNPTFLLIISYSVRRLPYIVRTAYAGYQQTNVALEEAALNLGASRWLTIRKITIPLIAANLIAGTMLTFSFAMLEVSDSLILAMENRFAPITKGIYELMGRPSPDSLSLACALGVLAMTLLAISLLISAKVLGKKTGQLFRT